MKDDEALTSPQPKSTPSIETLPDNADHTVHQYDAIDIEFYIEGAGDA